MSSISNGVIVLNSTKEIFYGGNLEEKHEKLSDIVAYSMSLYFPSGDGEMVLLSNGVEDMTGGTINVAGEIRKVSGDIIRESEIEEITLQKPMNVYIMCSLYAPVQATENPLLFFQKEKQC